VSLVDKNSVISSWSPTIEYIQSLSQEYEGYVGSVVDKYRYVVIGHMVALFILLVVIYLILRFNVTNPVLHLQSMIRDIGSGKKIVRDHRHDKQLEYCAIADALQLMQSDIGKLQNEVHQKRVSARIGEITSQIAHDLRSPLSVIGSFVDFVDKQGCLRGKDELEFIVATKRSVGRLRNMATELLDAPRAVSVNPLVQNVYVCMCNVSDEVSCVAADQKVKIDISTDEKFYAKLDFDKIHRVFVNMLVNAVEASRKNGLVKVFVERDADSLIVVVRDWGGGIPSDLIDSIFDSYFTSGKKNGTGLGLAYCKQVVEAHGGTIHVASEVGKGTTFTIRIPNCVVEGPGLQSAAVGATGVQLPSAALSDGRIVPMKTAPAPSPERSLNIIIADDDSDMLDDLARKAKARGATIAHQASAVEEIMADDKIDFSRIQAAIVDFEYKGSRMNGIDLIRYLKSMGVKDVHLCTGHFDDPDIRRQAREAGAASILKKPLDEDELAAIL
jgi:signal transduction histidine kinase